MSNASVKVAVRIRPMAAKELLANSSECVEVIPGTQQIVVGGGPSSGVGTDTFYSFSSKSFTFDHVFESRALQQSVYEQAVAPLVDRFLEGFNATILAYGQTGSGKTYSMGIALDSINALEDSANQGIVPRAIDNIFRYLTESKRKMGDSFKHHVTVSFLELYNEELVDLLNPRPRSASGTHSGPSIREDGSGKIVWYNVLEEPVTSPEELLNVLQRGTLCRTTGSTDMNASSSRSHAIFTVTLRQDIPATSDLPDRKLISKFHFVDLAGSERLKRTNAEGDRKKEGISINQGLLALGNVISALGDETRRSSHVPYRDSKLTRMLQDSLGGNSQTLMLACISPSDMNYGETVNTLHYANRARNIKNRVLINQEWGGGMSFGNGEREIKQLRATISQLRTEIAMMRAGTVKSVDAAQMPILEQRENQYHQRRERDLIYEIQNLKSQEFQSQFVLDQSRFYCNRLLERVKNLSQELLDTKKERDTIKLEKARLLNPSWIKYQKDLTVEKRITEHEDSVDIIDIVDEQKPKHDYNDKEMTQMIQGFHNTISQLKQQLSEAEDKLAWQKEAMSKLSRKGGKLPIAWGEEEPEKPMNQLVEKAKKPTKDEMHEQMLMHALRENIELREALSNEDAPLLDESKGFLSISKLQSGQEDVQLSPLSQQDEVPQAEEDVYLLINKIQNDIAQHEALVARIQRRDAEYDVMKKAYEQKLSVLQSQMAQFQVERDLALSKMQAGGSKNKAKTKFDEEKKQLETQIAEYRRKLGENSRMQNSNRSRSDMLTKELQATIEALKAEKSRMLLELRREAQKHRDMATANQREIAKLRRKEKNATEATKRLEKSNLIQRAMLKKRNEEVIKSQNKLRSVLQLLKRAATPNKIFKTITSGITSPRMSTRLPSRQEDRMRKRTLTGPVSDLLQRVSSPARLTIDNPAVDSASVEIRAQFKKQMVDKELATCVLCRRTQKKLEELKQERNKLVGEQRELIAERQRVVQATYEQTNVYDPDTPQYMDERVQAIDLEVSVIDEKMTHLEEIYKRSMGFIDESDPDAQAMDLSWDNALNILRSLDRIELETAVGFFLEDLIQFKVEKEDTTAREEERETVISNLKRMVEVLRTAMINQQQQVQEAQQEEEEQDSLRKKIEQERQAVINEERKLWQQEQKKAKDFLIPRQPSPTRSLAALDTVKKEVFGTIDKGIPRSLSVGTSRLSDIELPPIAAVADLERSGRTSPLRTISRRISPAPEDEPRKDEERRKLLGGSDVFERLANSHTLASQAKVISRTVITEEQPEIVQPQ